MMRRIKGSQVACATRVVLLLCMFVMATNGTVHQLEHVTLAGNSLVFRISILTEASAGNSGNVPSLHFNVSSAVTTSSGSVPLSVYLYPEGSDRGVGPQFANGRQSRMFPSTNNVWGAQQTATRTELYCPKDGLNVVVDADAVSTLLIGETKNVSAATVMPWVLNYTFSESGVYYLVASACEHDHPVQLSGIVSWVNPYGHLPGELWGVIPSYSFLCWTYVAILFVWISQMWYNRTKLSQLHWLCLYLSGTCMLEYTFWMLSYEDFNSDGEPTNALISVAIALNVARRVYSRWLLLVVGLGLYVVRSTIGPLMRKVASFCGVYAVLILFVAYMDAFYLPATGSFAFYIFIDTPVFVIDAFFVVWVLISIRQTLRKLRLRKNPHKLMLYRRFAQLLIVYSILSVGFIGFEYGLTSLGWGTAWKFVWLFTLYWDFVFIVFLSGVLLLCWRTDETSRYSLLVDDSGGDNLHSDDEFDFATFEMEEFGEVVEAAGPASRKRLEFDSDDELDGVPVVL